ncbi:MAG: mandelate racemase/muconate lactonizing enzyme family protein [Oscillospiraceae bacterium]
MKLTTCTPYMIVPPASNNGRGGRIFTFIKLETDAGITGWGECAAQDSFLNNWQCFAPIMNGLFEKFLKGEDALAREKLYKKMYGRFSSNHADFFTSSLFSAFDLALWDIAGKAFEQPVYQLLGGKYRDKLRSYSYIYTDPEYPLGEGWKYPDISAKYAIKMVDLGYTAVKFDPLNMLAPTGYPAAPWDLGLDELHRAESVIAAVRDAVGSSVDILIGTHGQITTSAAIRFGKMLQKYEVAWFEEPVSPENCDEMVKVANAVHVPVATGERLAMTHDYWRLLKSGAVAIAQPDLGTCGGLTEAKKIAGMCEPNFVSMAPHVWGGPIILAAAMQLDTCIPNFLIQECMSEPNAFFKELTDEPIVWKDGYFETLERPGLGINLNEAALEKYAAK